MIGRVVAAMLAAGPVAAQTTADSPPANTAASPVAEAAKTLAQVAAEKYRTEVVCRTSVETGSLIARRKVCLTRKQWQYVNDDNERLARAVVHDNTNTPAGN